MNSEHIPNGQVSEERLQSILASMGMPPRTENVMLSATECGSILTELLTRRSSAGVKVTDEMVERAYEAFVAACEWSDWDEPEVRGYIRAALTAALELPSHAGEGDEPMCPHAAPALKETGRAWRVEHGGGCTSWGTEADARKNAEATGGKVIPPGPVATDEDDERRNDGWSVFEADYLTDGEGHAPITTYEACRSAYDSAWNGNNTMEATREAIAVYKALHPSPSVPPQGETSDGLTGNEMADRVDAWADAVEEKYGSIRVTFNHGGVGRDGGSLSSKEICDMLSKRLRALTPDAEVELIERLERGVINIGLHDDNSTELFDIDEANDTMAEAAVAIRALIASRQPTSGEGV